MGLCLGQVQPARFGPGSSLIRAGCAGDGFGARSSAMWTISMADVIKYPSLVMDGRDWLMDKGLIMGFEKV